MTAQEKIQKVTEISQSKGWSISVDDKNKSNIQFDFQRYTNYGHGKNGAPYPIKDIVSDMEEAEKQIHDLLEALETEFI